MWRTKFFDYKECEMIIKIINLYWKRKLKKYQSKLGLGILSLKKGAQLNLEPHVRVGLVKLDGNHISINAYSYIRSGSEVIGDCTVGRFCSIGQDVVIGLEKNMHPVSWLTTSLFNAELERDYPKNSVPTVIGNDCWIGRGATIMSGVSVGDGAIVGARAVVTKDVPPYAVVVGSPARIVKYRFSTELINELKSSLWWNIDVDYLSKLDISKPKSCLSSLVAGPEANYPKLKISKRSAFLISFED